MYSTTLNQQASSSMPSWCVVQDDNEQQQAPINNACTTTMSPENGFVHHNDATKAESVLRGTPPINWAVLSSSTPMLYPFNYPSTMAMELMMLNDMCIRRATYYEHYGMNKNHECSTSFSPFPTQPNTTIDEFPDNTVSSNKEDEELVAMNMVKIANQREPSTSSSSLSSSSLSSAPCVVVEQQEEQTPASMGNNNNNKKMKKKKNCKKNPIQLMTIDDDDSTPLGEWDVPFGRGRGLKYYPGYQKFHSLLDQYRCEYEQASKFGKTSIANRIIKIIKSNGGSFYKKESIGAKNKDRMVKVTDLVARDKVSHAFRTKRRTDVLPSSVTAITTTTTP